MGYAVGFSVIICLIGLWIAFSSRLPDGQILGVILTIVGFCISVAFGLAMHFH